MGLSSSYFIAPSLQEYFVDKDTGLPLSGGQVFFYADNSRSTLKPVYELSGVPGNYTYTILPNPVTLSAVGTFQDASGNDTIPYYFPYYPPSSANAGQIQLYFIQVYDSNGVLQFTREAWPNLTAGGSSSTNQDITNFIPNGQFIIHDNIPASTANGFVVGKVSKATTVIAPGGWSFERSAMSTATDLVTFTRFGSSITVPTSNPRYAVQLECTQAGSDTIKDLVIQWPNVNTFASNTQMYNFYFEAQSVGAGSSIPNVQILVIKNFGTSGSAATEISVQTITLTANIQSFNIPILFGTNQSSTIGPNDDDFVQISIRLPPTGVQTALFANLGLFGESTVLTSFPVQTQAEQVAPSTAGWLADFDPNGADLYLPLILTPSGVEADPTQVGKIFASTTALGINELNADGAQYRTIDYSAVGIPYSRVQSVWFNGTTNLPLYGTGLSYATAYITAGSTSTISLASNAVGNSGTVAAPANVNTPFTFSIVNAAQASPGLTAQCFCNGATSLLIRGLTVGTVTAGGAGTSGFTVTMIENGGFRPITQVSGITAASALANPSAAGKYFTFYLNNSSNNEYYIWFQLTNETDPAPGGTGFKIVLLSTDTNADVTNKIINLVNGGYDYSIVTTAASSMSSSQYWTFGTLTSGYYVWYTINGIGTDPMISSSIGIKVPLLSTDAAADVATKTQLAINSMYFAVPDLRGLSLTGYDPTNQWDLDSATRFGYFNTKLFGDNIGTTQLSMNLSHNHTGNFHGGLGGLESPPYLSFVGNREAPFGGSDTIPSYSINNSGGTQSRSVNQYVRWVVKY